MICKFACFKIIFTNTITSKEVKFDIKTYNTLKEFMNAAKIVIRELKKIMMIMI